ncbi:argininosuccinate synthase [Candidatus Micrarchaeota archaeon]|nr:argininosuccinate synthase [Candidatus Micrarchaeota archaeon]
MIELPDYDADQVVLAYSGGLDTSCLLKLFLEKGMEVCTFTADLGAREYNDQHLDAAKQKALALGATNAVVHDVKQEFADEFVTYSIWANGTYQNHYPNSTALARPLVAKHLVDVAHAVGADAVAHGSTGKGNDQLRFELAVNSLDASLQVLAPIRDLQLSRDVEEKYAHQRGIAVSKQSTYSVDANLWGRSIECGPLENPAVAPPQDAFEWVNPAEAAPDQAETVKLHFEHGTPVELETATQTVSGTLSVIQHLNELAGLHGIGVFDHVEDRVVGFKSREVYECPAAAVILKAHFDLEKMVLTKDELDFKRHADAAFGEMTFQGKWFSPLMASLKTYLADAQTPVSGWVDVKLYKGHAQVIARHSENSLHQHALATYTQQSTFNQKHSEGFCKIYALQTVTANQVRPCGTTPDFKPSTYS